VLEIFGIWRSGVYLYYMKQQNKTLRIGQQVTVKKSYLDTLPEAERKSMERGGKVIDMLGNEADVMFGIHDREQFCLHIDNLIF